MKYRLRRTTSASARVFHSPHTPMFVGAALMMALIAFVSSGPARAQASTNFKMERVSVTAVGQTVSGASYQTTVVLGQESPAGAASSCNSGWRMSLGFWSVLADLPVPIRLLVDKDPTDSQVADLTWSGADDVFEVYRATSPQNVVDPTNPNFPAMECAASDATLAVDILFYQVISQGGTR